MEQKSKIYVAGHRGMVGSAILRLLQKKGYSNLIYKTSQELDLRNQDAVMSFFEQERPEYVFLAAAKVGGIYANNTYRADFLLDNLLIETNVIQASWKYQVKKLLFLGSSCIYPKYAPQPIPEEALLTGALEPTNEPYAIAKIAGIKLCENFRLQYGCNFISAMPTNLYGPNDNYDLQNSHVLPALIRKFHEAKIHHYDKVIVWGDGSPLREFLHVDDLAEACLFLMIHYDGLHHINVGSNSEISIKDLALLIKKILNYKGSIEFDTTKPNGTPRKLMDSSKILKLGWKPQIDLKTGIQSVYKDFQQHYNNIIQ